MKKQTIIGIIFILIVLSSIIFVMNYLHYFYINKNYVGNGIFLNLIAFISNILIGVFGFRLVDSFEKSENGWLLFISSPIFLFLLVVLLRICGASVEGYFAWIYIGVSEVHYLQVLLYYLFLSTPVAIDGMIKKSFKYEEIFFSSISFFNTMILLFTKDIQGVIWYSLFSLIYYFFKRGICIMPIGAVAIPAVCGLIYSVFNMSPFVIYEKIAEAQEYKYAYRYPLISMQQEFFVLAVVLVLSLDALICYLLKVYIKKYVIDEYKIRANFLCSVITAIWGIGIILDLMPYETVLFGSAPFSTNESFICLVPIIIILMLGKKEEQKGMN